MSEASNSSNPAPGLSPQAAIEAGVRQLIADGKSKSALDKARDLHKSAPTAASEALLLDAYAARIESLIRQNLAVEARSLLNLVRQRFPSSVARLELLDISAAAHGGTLDELVKPLNDPALSTDRRAAIERAIQNEVHDLAALSACQALPPEHPLRQAASALRRTLVAVTTGPVAEGVLALPEVSHRSPLAPWKHLVNAIHSFYGRDDDSCRRYLDAIKSESAPARLVPALRTLLDGQTPAGLSPTAKALIEEAATDLAGLRKTLDALDRNFASDEEGRIMGGIREAVQQCSRTAPSRLGRLKQHIAVRCIMEGFSQRRVEAALGGPAACDAYFERLRARSLEESGDPEDFAEACEAWDHFRTLSAREGRFSPNGPEAAAIYLHMAGLLGRMPPGLLREIRQSPPQFSGKISSEDVYYLYPETLYERACALDPHFDAFSKWLEFTRGASSARARPVAEAWHKACPRDLEPVLFLMGEAAAKRAFPTALKYLGKAEQIDGVHPTVRRARLRLLAGSALRHLQQNKPHLAEERVAEMAALPQSQQGDRPAMLAALRYLAAAARGDSVQAAAAQADVERVLQSKLAAALLTHGAAMAARNGTHVGLLPPGELSDSERAQLPAALARCASLARDMDVMDLNLPVVHFDEAAAQLSHDSAALGTDELAVLAEAGVLASHEKLAYAASTAGLERGGTTEARFLLLRAKALPDRQFKRRAACTAAALALARQQHDLPLAGEAVQSLHRFAPPDFAITPDQVAEVLAKERREGTYPKPNSRGPDYSEFFNEEDKCQCPNCRRERGEEVDLDEVDAMFDDILDEIDLPKGMPPELAKILLAASAISAETGEPVDEMLQRMAGGPIPPKKGTKGKRR